MFNLRKIVGGRTNVPEPECQVAGADITPGMTLKLADGVLALCVGTETPTHISDCYAKAGENAAVHAVAHDQVYEVPCGAAPGELNPGDKVTIGADGLTVTATTTGGVATIVSTNGAAAAGDTLYVKF